MGRTFRGDDRKRKAERYTEFRKTRKEKRTELRKDTKDAKESA